MSAYPVDDSIEEPTGFYWLVPPGTARGGLAGMANPTAGALSGLPKRRIGLVVSLMEGGYPSPSMPQGIRLARLPIADGEVPADAHLALVTRLCAYVHAFRMARSPSNSVVVHCLHGRGRTGLMLASYRAYVAARYPGDPDGADAAETAAAVNENLRAVYGIPVPALTAHQLQWVAQFQRHLLSPASYRPDETAAYPDCLWNHWREGLVHARAWRCDECGCRLGTNSETPTPTWCPCCGWPASPVTG